MIKGDPSYLESSWNKLDVLMYIMFLKSRGGQEDNDLRLVKRRSKRPYQQQRDGGRGRGWQEDDLWAK